MHGPRFPAAFKRDRKSDGATALLVTEAKRRFHLDQLSCASVKIDERSEAQKSNAEKNSKGDVQCLK